MDKLRGENKEEEEKKEVLSINIHSVKMLPRGLFGWLMVLSFLKAFI